MNILLLMAGSSESFKQAGYTYPKNLIEIEGLPLVQHVIEKLENLLTHNNHLVCMVQREENRRSHISSVIHLLSPNATVLEVSSETAGAACTALLAIEHINTSEPLVIVNGDQIIEADINPILTQFQHKDWDGGIVVFEAVHPRWSYVRCNAEGLVIEAAEKRPISKQATAGIYYFARGQDFVSATISMIKKDAHVEGKFYICPVYNEMLLNQAKIGVKQIPRTSYFSLANPQGFHIYEEFIRPNSKQL
jgi:dTDP-glucose pyrophosphorylase